TERARPLLVRRVDVDRLSRAEVSGGDGLAALRLGEDLDLAAVLDAGRPAAAGPVPARARTVFFADDLAERVGLALADTATAPADDQADEGRGRHGERGGRGGR